LNVVKLSCKGYGNIALARKSLLSDGTNSLELTVKRKPFFAIKHHSIQELNMQNTDTSFSQPKYPIKILFTKAISLGINSRRFFSGITNGFELHLEFETDFFEKPPFIQVPDHSIYVARAVGRSGIRLNEYKEILEYSIRRRQVESKVIILTAELIPLQVEKKQFLKEILDIETNHDSVAAANLLTRLPIWHGLRTYFSLYFNSPTIFNARNIFTLIHPIIEESEGSILIKVPNYESEFSSKKRRLSESPIFFQFNTVEVMICHGSNIIKDNYLISDDSSEKSRSFSTAMWPAIKWGNSNTNLLATPYIDEQFTVEIGGNFLPTNTNWAHFLEDIAPRAALLSEGTTLENDSYTLTTDDTQIKILQVIDSRKIKNLDFFSPVHFKELSLVFHLNNRNQIVNGTSGVGELCTDVRLMNEIRQKIFGSFHLENKKDTKLFIYRDQRLFRRLVNQKRILKYLESRGYKSVRIETWSLKDRTELLSTCSHIIYEYGAGGANNYLARDGVKVIELRHPGNIRSLEQNGLIKTTSVIWRSLVCVKSNPLSRIVYGSDSWRVPIKNLKGLLNEWE